MQKIDIVVQAFASASLQETLSSGFVIVVDVTGTRFHSREDVDDASDDATLLQNFLDASFLAKALGGANELNFYALVFGSFLYGLPNFIAEGFCKAGIIFQ